MSTVNHDQSFTELYRIIKKLRGPGGCPWDQKQTPESIKKYLLEEATELAQALSGDNQSNICEELGDLFFILVLIVIIYEEEGCFTAEEVFAGISRKMIRRHPHVFADVQTGSESELKKQWEAIKAREKNKM